MNERHPPINVDSVSVELNRMTWGRWGPPQMGSKSGFQCAPKQHGFISIWKLPVVDAAVGKPWGDLLIRQTRETRPDMAENHYAFAAPIVPGKLEAWKAMVKEMKGAKKKEYQASRKKMGVKHERAWLQHTPQGDFVVVSIEGKEAPKLFEKFAASKEPFDKWFLAQIAEVHGIQLPSGVPPTNELYLDIL